jgi:drug/metabolite transporter (DMT)-like permease
MIVGEIGNFIAYGLAPASLVSPLGAIAVISNAILSRIILKEESSYKSVAGVCFALGGAVLIILNAPTTMQDGNNHQMYNDIISWKGLVFLLIVAVCFTFIANPFDTGYGISEEFANQHVLCYCAVCSLVGAISVTSAKVVSTAITQGLAGDSSMLIDSKIAWLTYMLMVGIIISTLTQIIYLNLALKHFGASIVVPVYYIMFTSMSIAAGMVLFEETVFDPVVQKSILFVLGVVLAFVGVYLINTTHNEKEQEQNYDDDEDEDDIYYDNRQKSIFHSKKAFIKSLDVLNYDAMI